MKKWEKQRLESDRIELPCYPKEEGVYIITDDSNNVYYIGNYPLDIR